MSAQRGYAFAVDRLSRLNDFLQRCFGIRVIRFQRERAEPVTKTSANSSNSRSNTGSLSQSEKEKLPDDYEPEFGELWELVRQRTMTSHPKAYGLYQAVRYIVGNNIPGDIVECGVWRGGAMLAVAHQLVGLGSVERDLYLFDTYEGMTQPTARDVQISTNQSARQRLLTADSDSLVWAIASLEDVRAGFAHVAYPTDRIHFVKGPVEDTLPGRAPDEIAILRLDTDWYESTRHELEHLYRRLVPGGVLILDDYGYWQGAKDAVDEFLATTGEPLLMLRAATGRIAVKPGLSSSVYG